MNAQNIDFDPMVYDALRELCTRISGRYVAWEYAAKSKAEEEHWEQERFRLNAEVRAVDPNSFEQIQAKRLELRERYAALLATAPELAFL
ncbi:MAG: hypothetical protein Q4C71_01445 [Microbacteriaceae bacterium]|nr:hypothetical protein [Microbacteriaceae bacterium]